MKTSPRHDSLYLGVNTAHKSGKRGRFGGAIRGPEEEVVRQETQNTDLPLCHHNNNPESLNCRFLEIKGSNLHFCGRGKEACPLD